MKKHSITFLLTILMSMMGVHTFAHDIEVVNADGVTIYYNYINNNTELAVSYRSGYYSNEYTGNVVIPESVTYNGTTYSVTSIGYEAFKDCSGLTSITIPNSVTRIGSCAFLNCSGLTSVTIVMLVKLRSFLNAYSAIPTVPSSNTIFVFADITPLYPHTQLST